MLTVDEIKTYCRIDEDVDAELLNVYLPAAEAYVKDALDDKGRVWDEVPQYRLLVLMLINHWYNNRDTVVVGTITAKMPHMWDVLMQQLQTMGGEQL